MQNNAPTPLMEWARSIERQIRDAGFPCPANMDTRSLIKFFFLAMVGKSAKEQRPNGNCCFGACKADSTACPECALRMACTQMAAILDRIRSQPRQSCSRRELDGPAVGSSNH